MSGDALHRFIDTVEGHYKSPNPEPLLLSRFGQQHKELLAELKAEFVSLKAAVRAAGEDRIRFIDTTVGREAIAPVAIAAELQLQIQEDSASRQQAANYFESLPTPVQIAFCVRTDAGENVAIDTVRPFRFAKVTAPDLVRPTQRIIPDVYRRPGLSLRTASLQDRETLWRLFLAWSSEANVDPGIFRQGEASTALGRLLAAQPADLIPRLVIPADIAQILLKHS
ncbi:hypothetical protein NKH57_02000 [Mesorhizobium sp. M1050]|uniref:hypothetical protein n=1 Tax=unclassified Mesorhizobium TaxID=325217 RepID=UPI00333DCC9C